MYCPTLTASLCAICLGRPAVEAIESVDSVAPVAPATPPASGGEGAAEGDGAINPMEDDALVDDGWRLVPGGPFVAKLMKPSRQPPAQAEWRRFYVAVAFDPVDTPLTPGDNYPSATTHATEIKATYDEDVKEGLAMGPYSETEAAHICQC